MVKENELREFRPQIQYRNGDSVTLEAVQQALANAAEKAGVAVAFRNDQLKYGGLLNAKAEPCIVLYHPEHEKDYYQFCIRVHKEGEDAIVSVNEIGESTQMNKEYRSEIAKQGVKSYIHADSGDYNTMGRSIGAAIGGALGSIGKSKKKLEVEKGYYQQLIQLFDAVIY